MRRIFDSLNVFLACQLVNGDIPRLKDKEDMQLIGNALKQFIDKYIVTDQIEPIQFKIDHELQLSAEGRAIGHLALAVLYMAKRQYDIAESHISAAADHPEKVVWWHFSGGLVRSILQLYKENYPDIACSSDWVSLLSDQSPSYQIDWLTSFVIIVCSKFVTFSAIPSWFESTKDALESACKILEINSSIDQLRKARILQAQGCLYCANEDFKDAYNSFREALVLAEANLGKIHSYNTELMVDMARTMAFQKQFNDVRQICKSATECEIAGPADPLRLARIFNILGETYSASREPELAYENCKRALILHESASNFHYGDRLIILHRMRMLAQRLHLPSEIELIKAQVANLHALIDRTN